MHILMVAARCYPFMGGIETHIQEVGPRLVARLQRRCTHHRSVR